MVHYNIQSIANKLDLIETELRHFDVICLTDTWLDARTFDDLLLLKDYKLYRRDRSGDNHDGICVSVRNNIYSCRRNDIELPDIECVWVEVITHNKKKQLIGTFYRPPNSNNTVISTIEDSIGLDFDTNIKNILITGDFNLDTLKQVSNKIIDLCQHHNLEQLINEPTNFTETSSLLYISF